MVLITRRDVPIAEINPPSGASAGPGWLGSMRESATITGDLVGPVATDVWNALHSQSSCSIRTAGSGPCSRPSYLRQPSAIALQSPENE